MYGVQVLASHGCHSMSPVHICLMSDIIDE